MPHKIIGVFRDLASMRVKSEALKKADFKVCTAQNLQELKRHLEDDHCDLVLIGHAIPASEKLRIARFVRQYDERCALLEIHRIEPELEMADAHIHHEAGAEVLVAAVTELLKSRSHAA